MTVWMVVIAAGLASYALRAALVASGVELPASVQRRLQHGAPAVIAALIATSLTRPSHGPGLAAQLAAVAAAFAAARRFRSVAVGPLAGLLVLVAVGALISVVDR